MTDRLDWTDMVPQSVADRQRAYERRRALARAKQAGATTAELARHLHLSSSRVARLLDEARRDGNRPAPVLRYLTKSGSPHEVADRLTGEYRRTSAVHARVKAEERKALEVQWAGAEARWKAEADFWRTATLRLAPLEVAVLIDWES